MRGRRGRATSTTWKRLSTVVAAAALAASGGGIAAAPHAAGATNPASPAPGSPAARTAHSVPGLPGLPTGVPPAATAAAAQLPAPPAATWPFPSTWSHTEGTGHLAAGADLWTDFAYDDHGAADVPGAYGSSGLAPDHGSYTYPTGAGFDGNNADIFAAGVGEHAGSTYWRVDWTSLPDPSIPIAEWTMAPGGGAPTTTAWPANAGLTTSTGITYALVVTGGGARLLDAPTGRVLATFPTAVDAASRSFVVTVPTATLPVSGTWKVQLAAGLADTSGPVPVFATVPASRGGLPAGGANAYNVTFRTAAQEAAQVCPAYVFDSAQAQALEQGLDNTGTTTPGVPTVECANNWMENDQANTLLGSSPDVAKYALAVDWSQLAAAASTPEPRLHGYTNRWYVTPLDLSHYGAGVRPADSSTYTGPTYLSRIQPYAVYVPSTYDFSSPSPTPLTWVLHSLGANLNQYGGTDPTQVTQECEQRHSICATTEGFSAGEWYYAEAEVDFFDVWHQLAAGYDLDPDATAITGYSMGGWASWKLAEEYPDLFAQAMPLEGPVICGEQAAPGVNTYAGGTQCTTDGQSGPLLADLRWIPYVETCGGAEELVPISGCDTQAMELQGHLPVPTTAGTPSGVTLDYRDSEFVYPAEEHLSFAVQNDFTPPDSQLGNPALDRRLRPGGFTYTWYPDLDSGAAGIDGAGRAGWIGPSRDYWLDHLAGRTTAPGTLASVVADSAALPDPAVTTTTTTTTGSDPTPYVDNDQQWVTGATPAPAPRVSLQLTDVGAATVEVAAAGLACGTVAATTDGPTALTLAQLAPGSAVTSGGRTVATASSAGVASVALAQGRSALGVCSSRTALTKG